MNNQPSNYLNTLPKNQKNRQLKLLRPNLSEFQGDSSNRLNYNQLQLAGREITESKVNNLFDLNPIKISNGKSQLFLNNLDQVKQSNLNQKINRKGSVLEIDYNQDQYAYYKSKTPQQANLKMKNFKKQGVSEYFFKNLKLPKIANKKETIKTLEDDIVQLNKILQMQMQKLSNYRSLSARQLQINQLYEL